MTSINGDRSDLVRRMEITKEIRFAMVRRFRKMNNSDQLFISGLSLLIVITSMVSIVFSDDFSSKQVSAIGVFSVSISIYIIMLNYEFSKRDFERKILQIDQSASKIHDIYVELKNESSQEIINEKYKKYKKIINKFNFEHEEVDKNFILASNVSLRKESDDILDKDAQEFKKNYNNAIRSRLINQMIFPVVCVFVLFSALWFYQQKPPSADRLQSSQSQKLN